MFFIPLLYNLSLPILALFISIIVLVSLRRGPVFLPTHQKGIDAMLRMSGVGKGDKALDLGSGDGRIVIALARAGAEAHGYEHNPFLVWWSRFRIRRAELSGRAFIHQGNFWKCDFAEFSVITVFGIPYIMTELGRKIRQESKNKTRVLSYTFSFPKWAHDARQEGVYLYRVRK